MGDVIFGTEAGYLLAGEVGSIVGDDSVGNPEAMYYVLPEEFDNMLLADFGEWYCLDLLGKVADGHQ